MCPGEDEAYRSIRYGGHPAACTCVACCEARREGRPRYKGEKTSSGGIPIWFWIVIGIVIVAVVLGLVFG